jgi:DNA-binding XRE family transcriptional regulator
MPRITKQQSQAEPISAKKYQPPKQIDSGHQEFLLKIGLELQELRKENNISASALAKSAGISRNGYHLMETGRIYFNISTILQILTYYEKSPAQFFSKVSRL